MKKVLVTGGAGFIGSHLCRKLLIKGYEVICLDNLMTCDRSNIYDLIGNPKFSFVLHDITQPFRIQIDEIYNLACPNSPQSQRKNPVETTKTSVVGAINMLELASRMKAKILQASTSRVYGLNLDDMPDENNLGTIDNIALDSCYTEGKRAAETLFMDYHREYGVDVKIARIFFTYGPNMQKEDSKLLSDFILKALSDQDLVIYGDGSKKLSMQYVDDLVDGLIKFMNKDDFIGPVNIGNSFDVSILSVAQKILEHIPTSKSKIVFGDGNMIQESDHGGLRYSGSAKLAHDKLGRKPRYSLDEGLKKTIEYFKTYLKYNS